ncbi:hypothetical protein BBF93_08565 [Hyphomonas sp. CACIAM 19H1]|uniref:hypothetical protein n=1 Tax=Hyphomonas sp. CACIAM 19H1 TaxID=1873716 RepID=UPI000DED76C1|nr:hypothetical protein [Hyphomonas sp. CACIAM 19H1]AXE64269.1 hypothetical protein BBF93_08565 [Hyphomonas sp. CACIAM 19H1]
MENKEFRQRISAFEKGEILWRAYPDRLEKHGADGALQLTIPYDRVRRVRIAWASSRAQPGRLLMELTGERSRVTISNMHYAGFANFEDRAETFYPMMWQVALGVRRSNPGAEFRAGERAEIYWPLLSFAFGALVMLAGVLLALPIGAGNIPASVFIKGGFVLIALPLLLGWAWKARPRKFNPDTDLEEMIAIR